MARTLSFLMSDEAAKMRIKRSPEAKYAVHLETWLYEMEELDADDLDHAMNIARDWMKNKRCMSACVRERKKGGSLSGCVVIFDEADF
jgi:hypothetical protein